MDQILTIGKLRKQILKALKMGDFRKQILKIEDFKDHSYKEGTIGDMETNLCDM